MNPHLAVVSGASSGIGAATAKALAAVGWQVVLVARGRAELEDVHSSIGAAGGRAALAALDAGDGDQVAAMAERVRRELGSPSLVVNSAGFGAWKFLEDTPTAETAAMVAAPYLAAANLSRAFLPAMLERRAGLLVHVGSPASRIPWPGATSYTAMRWALRGLHEALCQDLTGTGVRSCHVVFGEVRSPYFEHNHITRDQLPGVGRLVPAVTPERCAEVILRTVRRPRREVVHPFMLRLFYMMAAVAPGPTRRLVAATGRRHQGRDQERAIGG
jgi:NADP-dependent 3-hydroxy acid dehydrogenase YdfG